MREANHLRGLQASGAARRENGFLFRHCEERSDEAIQSLVAQKTGLLRFARNDEGKGPGRESEPGRNAPHHSRRFASALFY